MLYCSSLALRCLPRCLHKLTVYCAVTLLVWSPQVAFSDSALGSSSNAQAAPSLLPPGYLLNVVLALAAVIAAFFAMTWLLKRMGSVGGRANGAIELSAALSVGSKERIVLVKAGGKRMLLGVAPGCVQMLHLFDNADAADDDAASDDKGAPSAFRKHLEDATDRGRSQ